jgi:hypothetical protein
MAEITEPTYFRAGRNLGATAITAAHLLTVETSEQDGVQLATGSTDEPNGVAIEAMAVDGVARSIQVGGRCEVVAGAAVAIGDKITSDSTGRGVPTTSASASKWGRAVTAQATVGSTFELEMREQTNAGGGTVVYSLTLTDDLLTASANTQSFAFATLPANARVLGYEWDLTEAFTDGSAGTFNLDIGISGAEESIAASLDVDGASLGSYGAAVFKTFSAAAVIARMQSSVNVVTATAGSVTLRLFCAVAA